jgi:glucose-6-phosphate isomerase
MTVNQKDRSSDSTPSIDAALKMALQGQADADKKLGIRAQFSENPGRAEQFSYELEGLFFDFSKTHISESLISLYTSFADQIGFDESRSELFTGAKINSSEDRPVLHALLRDPKNQGIPTLEPSLLEDATDARNQFLSKHQEISANLESRKIPVKDIIHVGIGGSSLGTQLVFEALKNVSETRRIHFIGNIDGHQLSSILAQCDVTSTLVIGVSKTFATSETLQNIRTIGQWFSQNGIDDYLECVYAVTATADNAAQFGIPLANTIVFPQWVGGRYSVWSAVSLSAALILGQDKFSQFLDGAAAIDQHFHTSSVDKNICFIAAMMDHYYTNFCAASNRAIFAYDHRLRSLVDYLQQLETESNGKNRQRNGSKVDQFTSPIVWGGVGTDVQHSVFQLLHQGTWLIPSEFLLVAKPEHDLTTHHSELLANGIAQTAALLAGQSLQKVREVHANENLSELAACAKIFDGDRPSTTILIDYLDPRSLGSLLAFYEHRTYCNGLFCNINSFDQMGVELGKRLAKQVLPLLQEQQELEDLGSDLGFDPSTLNLIKRLK